jgi:vacuolar-type H+-ATPase subunit I/STV1
MATNTCVSDFQSDAAWGHMEKILSIIDANQVENSDYRKQVHHIRYVVAAALTLRDIPPVFVSASSLANVQSAANNIHAYLQQWVDQENESQIASAYSYLESLQNAAGGWSSGKADSLRSASAALRETVKAIDNAYADIEEKVGNQRTQLSKMLEQYKQSALEQTQATEQRLSTVQQEATSLINNVQSHATQLETALATVERRNNSTLESLQKQFNAAEVSRTETDAALIRDNGTALSTALSDARADLEKYRKNEESSFKEVKQRVDQLKDDIEKVVGAVGTTATAKWYEIHADKQQKAADTFRLVAFVAFVAAFGVIAITVFWVDHAEDSWKSTVLKSTATATLVAGAVYASNESRKHRDKEFELRKTELTLRALDPFIATLDERDELKAEAARRVFSLSESDDADVADMLDDGAQV